MLESWLALHALAKYLGGRGGSTFYLRIRSCLLTSGKSNIFLNSKRDLVIITHKLCLKRIKLLLDISLFTGKLNPLMHTYYSKSISHKEFVSKSAVS